MKKDEKDVKRYHCINYGACAKADSGEIIEIDALETIGGTPDCPCCHQHTLEEIVKKSINWKLIAAIIALVLVLGGGAGYFFGVYQPQQKALALKQAENERLEAEKKQKEAQAEAARKAREEAARKASEEEQARLAALKQAALLKADSILAANEKLVQENEKNMKPEAKVAVNSLLAELRTAVKYEDVDAIDSLETPINEAWKDAIQKATTTVTSGKNPSWGRYEGPRDANGLPHGSGVLRITRTTTINGQTAQPGERIEGVFRNGYVNMGTWYQNGGNAVVVKDLKAY